MAVTRRVGERVRLGGRCASDPLPGGAASKPFFLSPQLLSLNLSTNKLYRLDDMSSIVQKAPNLKILNLSGNEVGIETRLCFGWDGQRVERTCVMVARGRERNLRDGGGVGV